MTKIHFFIILLVTFLSVQMHAGMERTRACNDQIIALESTIKSLQKNVEELQTEERNRSEDCSDLETSREKFSKLPLIPSILRKWKQSSLDEKITRLKSEIESITKKRENKERNLQKQRDELSTEKARLRNYKTITIIKIKIDAYGPWDAFLPPEIIVEMGDSVIAKGAENTYNLDSSLYEDATRYDNLYVYDDDLTEWVKMGKIPLKKTEIPLGVSGDKTIRILKGNVARNSKLGFNYTVEYEVKY